MTVDAYLFRRKTTAYFTDAQGLSLRVKVWDTSAQDGCV